MPLGPGKYDDILTEARRKAGITDTTTGGLAALIVLGGSRGNGFGVQGDLFATAQLPAILRSMAEQIEETLRRGEM